MSVAVEVVTEVEAEWSDDDRAQLLGLATYEAGLCECGVHESLSGDRSNHFTFEDQTCPVCAGLAQYRRMQDEADSKRTRDDAPAAARRPSDGRHLFVRQMNPDEIDTRRNRRGGGRGGGTA